ncbi:MAG TPA: ABC transporter ATP-binding protein [Actinopolymorphaceae bacterium]
MTRTASSTTRRGLPFTLRAFWLMVSLSFRADPLGATLLCLAMPTYYLSPAAGAIGTKFLIDAAVQGRISDAIWAGVFAGFAVLAAAGSLKIEVYLSHSLEKKVGALVQRRMAESLIRLPGIEHYERSDYQDQIQQLRDSADEIGSGLLATMNMLGLVCQAVVVCALLADRTPWLLLLPVFAIPSFLATGISNRWHRRAMEETAEAERLSHRIVAMGADLPVARETRLFDLGAELRKRRRLLAARIDAVKGAATLRSTVVSTLGNLIFAGGYFGAIVLVVGQAVRGELTAGDVALTVVLAGQAHGFIADLVEGAQYMAGVFVVAARMRWLTEYEAEHRDVGEGVPAPEQLTDGIRLERVTFRYPGTQQDVLRDVSLRLPAGAVVAVVGENGAGKSTLVKLLLGYYRPTSGRILADQLDLAAVDVRQWRRRCSGAFQDYLRLEFLARESIGLGEPERLEDAAAVHDAAKRAGAADVVDGLPGGLETQLGAGWENGVDLSGGQWQRMALARALMREQPLVLVLDEPTAALDAQTEHELFEGFADGARLARENGGITVLVTHRFSTVRMADLIVVLDEGRIRELGSHEDLMARNGLYAELFALQAAAYR